MERKLVEQKLAVQMREPAYQVLEEDPTNKYEKAANNLLTDICTDLGLDVTKPPIKHVLSNYSSAPELYPMAWLRITSPAFPTPKFE